MTDQEYMDFMWNPKNIGNCGNVLKITGTRDIRGTHAVNRTVG